MDKKDVLTFGCLIFIASKLVQSLLLMLLFPYVVHSLFPGLVDNGDIASRLSYLQCLGVMVFIAIFQWFQIKLGDGPSK